MLSQYTPPAPGFEDTYSFKIDSFYSIWFSYNPEVFLGIENQLRLIRTRLKNPKAKLALIYSSECLNQSSIDKLKYFCRQYRISPFDFDTELLNLLEDSFDIKMYEIAKLEIQMMLAREFGNLASASDCTRLIVPLIEKFGIYSEFDVEHSLSKLNASIASLRAPVILHSRIVVDVRHSIVMPNSDFLAFSFNPQQPRRLSREALLAVRNVQELIIRKYSEALTPDTFFADKSLDKTLPKFYNKFFELHKHATIFEFRKYFQNSDIKDSDKEVLYKCSVIAMSGPDNYQNMYKQLVPAGITSIPHCVPNNAKWLPYMSTFNKSSILFYAPIADLIKLQNNIATRMDNYDRDMEIGELADLSWTKKGADATTQREIRMDKAALTIQRFFKKIDPHTIIKFYITKLCNDKLNYMKYLNEKKYSLLLRNASNDANAQLIRVLLKYKDQLNININEPSGNQNTALDWANQSTNVKSKKLVVELLILSGAKTKEELVALQPEAELSPTSTF